MEADADVPAPGAATSRRAVVTAVVASIVFHALVMAAVRWASPEPTARSVSIVDVDIDLAPLPPAAEVLPPEQEMAPLPPAASAPDEVEAPELPTPTGEGAGVVDAGVDAAPPVDAAVDARRRRRDAGVDAGERELEDDGGLDAEAASTGPGPDAGDAGDASDAIDAQMLDDGGERDAGERLANAADGGVGDGGPLDPDAGAAVASAEPRDGGTPAGDGGLGNAAGAPGVGPGQADPAGLAGARPSAGTDANLLGYFPGGHLVTVLVRLDRLRGTEWAERMGALLRPLPDHRALVGDQPIQLADTFDVLVFSSPDPQDAAATTLVARTALAPPALRDFLDQPDAPVAWSAVKGGALGRRGRSPRVYPGDQRVFLSWEPGWMVLTQPRDLGGLTAARSGALDRAARATDLPPWLARASTITGESGEPSGPAIMLTAANMFGDELPLMGVAGASVPAPERATLTLEVVARGFLVKGNLRYPDESRAATAHDAIMRLRADILARYGRMPVLGGFPLLTVLRGLDVRRTGRRLAFASSASIADSRALLSLAEGLVTEYFQARRPPPARPPAPQPRLPP